MRKIVITFAALVAVAFGAFAFAVPASADVLFHTNEWTQQVDAPASMNSNDQVWVDLWTDESRSSLNVSYTSAMRFTATVQKSASEAITRVSIERVALSGASGGALFVWLGKRLGANGFAQVGPSYPWSKTDGCNYRMRINYSARWADGSLSQYSWLTPWQPDPWPAGCGS
jgi:hypothetical protein